MSIFQPPTDNLYKFMAISGLVILGFSLIWPSMGLYELDREQVRLMGEMQVLMVESIDLEKDQFIWADEVNAIEKMERGLRNNSDKDHESRWAKVRLKLEQQREKNHLIKIKTQELKTKTDLNRLALTSWKRLVWVLTIGSLAGFILSLLGFILWYMRLQRFQDMVTKRQALSNESTTGRSALT